MFDPESSIITKDGAAITVNDETHEKTGHLPTYDTVTSSGKGQLDDSSAIEFKITIIVLATEHELGEFVRCQQCHGR